MNRAITSLALSLVASAVATIVLRRFMEASSGPPRPGEGSRQGQFAPNVVIVWMPILVGNSGNSFGPRPPGKRGPFRKLRRA